MQEKFLFHIFLVYQSGQTRNGNLLQIQHFNAGRYYVEVVKGNETTFFITTEGFTFQPGSESPEPDVENCQVIGFAKGSSINEAFENLIAENKYLLKTSFNEITGYELRHHDYRRSSKTFCLSARREIS